MAILIRNAYVFAPKELGVTDVLMVGEKILAVGPNLSVNLPGLSVIDATGFIPDFRQFFLANLSESPEP